MRNVFAGSMVLAGILFAGQIWSAGDSVPGIDRREFRLADGSPPVRRPERAPGDIPQVRRPQREHAAIRTDFV
jgi:hypothetical protein